MQRWAIDEGELFGNYAKVMAIPEIAACLRFLNRGQAWVVRKINEMLPRVRDTRLHEALKAMRDGHVGNIELMTGF